MRIVVRAVVGTLVTSALAIAAACGHSSGGARGSCPCTVGDPGATVTLACGQSACATLDGATIEYSCESDGTHVVDASACVEGGGPPQDGATEKPPPYEAGLLPDGAAPPGECVDTSDAGFCSDPNDCVCTSGGACTFACGADQSDGGMTLVCGQFGKCGVSCATDCQVDCKQSTSCGFSVGGGSHVNCVQTVGCEGTVGPGSVVDCTQSQSCMVTCTGDCTVACAQAGGCRITCPAGADAGACNVECQAGAPTLCPDGVTRVCPGTSC